MIINENKMPEFNQQSLPQDVILANVDIDKNHLAEKPLWYEIDGKMYYFKPRQDDRALSELINREFYKVQNLYSAHYAAAKVNGQSGLLSQNFQTKGNFYEDIDQLYRAYYIDKNNYSLQNLLQHFATILPTNVYDNIETELINLYLSDYFAHQLDRNPRNVMLEEAGQNIHLAKIFDSEKSLGIKKRSFQDLDSKSLWIPSMPYEAGLEPSEIDNVDINIMGLFLDYPEKVSSFLDTLLKQDYYNIINSFTNRNQPLSLTEEDAKQIKELLEYKQEKIYTLKRM